MHEQQEPFLLPSPLLFHHRNTLSIHPREVPMSYRWKLSFHTLHLLWNSAFPRYVATRWRDDAPWLKGKALKKEIKGYLDVSKAELDELDKMTLQSREDLYFDYFSHENGIVFPQPPPPFLPEDPANLKPVFQAYDGRLGDVFRPRILLPAITDLHQTSTPNFFLNVQPSGASALELARAKAGDGAAGSPTNRPPEVVGTEYIKRKKLKWYLTGARFSNISYGIQRIIVNAWEDEDEWAAFAEDPPSFAEHIKDIMRFQIEMTLPDNFAIEFHENTAEQNSYLTNRGILMPFPNRPTLDDMYAAWSAGTAQIPTFSATTQGS